MYDPEVETRFNRFECFPERDRFPIVAAIDQDDRALVAAVGERSDHAHHGRDAHAASDQHMHVGRVSDGEGPVRAVDVNAPASGHFRNFARQVSQVSDRHLHTPVGDLRTGREGEWMASDLERPTPNRKPAKLSWSESEARVTMRPHHECPAITTLLADFRNHVRPTHYEQRLDDTHVKQEADPEDGQPYPQCSLLRVDQVKAPPDHMNDSSYDCDHSQQDVH